MLHKQRKKSRKKLPKITKNALLKARKMVSHRSQKQMFTGIQFEPDHTRSHIKRPSSMDIFIRQRQLKLENL